MGTSKETRHRTCPVSGLPLAEIRCSLKTPDGLALDFNKLAAVAPEFAELQTVAGTIGEPVLIGFGPHRDSVNAQMGVDRRAGEGRALSGAAGLRVNSSYHLVQVDVGDGVSPLILYATLPTSVYAGNGDWRELRAKEKNTKGLWRGR